MFGMDYHSQYCSGGIDYGCANTKRASHLLQVFNHVSNDKKGIIGVLATHMK